MLIHALVLSLVLKKPSNTEEFSENVLKIKAQFPLLMFGLELITYSLLIMICVFWRYLSQYLVSFFLLWLGEVALKLLSRFGVKSK